MPLALSTTPALFPEFDPRISDFVVRCADNPIDLTVVARGTTSVAIDGLPPRSGRFSTTIPLKANQSFSFMSADGSTTRTHYVRCLPTDFPEWRIQQRAASAQAFYVVTSGAYVMAFDASGVPIWWRHDTGTPSDAKVLDDGTFAWASDRSTPDARYVLFPPDGRWVRSLTTVGTPTDGHDMQRLPNGHYMLMSYRERPGTVDLRAFGGPPAGVVLDAELQEITPDGTKVWEWNSRHHIPLAETAHWFTGFIFPLGAANGPFDIVHINSVDVGTDAVVVSMRHTDGVYKIDRATGQIVWKLGGTRTRKSLTVVGDPMGPDPFGGQHDARMSEDGLLTVFDNGQPRNRQPRAVSYRIDERARTAVFVEAVTDPAVSAAVCCGSAHRTATGGWVVGWGGGPEMNPVAEYAADGSLIFQLRLLTGFSYRVFPVAEGLLDRAALRSGMDAQHPR